MTVKDKYLAVMELNDLAKRTNRHLEQLDDLIDDAYTRIDENGGVDSTDRIVVELKSQIVEWNRERTRLEDLLEDTYIRIDKFQDQIDEVLVSVYKS